MKQTIAIVIFIIVWGGNVGAQTTPNAVVPPADNSKPTIEGTFIPVTFVGPDNAIFALTLRFSEPIAGAMVRLVPPDGFRVDPEVLPATGTAVTRLVQLRRSEGGRGRERQLIVRIFRQENDAKKAVTVITEKAFEFRYDPLMAVPQYLLMGGIGIVLGYFIRAATKQLAKTPPDHQVERAKIQNDTTSSTARKWFVTHWYAIDFLVTLIVGTVVLVVAMKDGLPPTTAPHWHNAFGTGFALGLLTNSELLTRIR